MTNLIVAGLVDPYNHEKFIAQALTSGGEAEHNLKLYGGLKHAFTLLDVTHELTPEGRVRRVRLRRQKFEIREKAWEIFVHRTVKIRAAMRLRRKFWQHGPQA